MEEQEFVDKIAIRLTVLNKRLSFLKRHTKRLELSKIDHDFDPEIDALEWAIGELTPVKEEA